MDDPTLKKLSWLNKTMEKGEQAMKRLILAVLAVGLLISLSSLAFAGVNPGTGIKGTAHDMSSGGASAAFGYDSSGLDRICIYCHTPHFANTDFVTFTYSPLWNHNNTTITSWSTYTNTLTGNIAGLLPAQLNATLGPPSSISLLCLGCHDGSVAVAAYGNLGGGLNPSKGNPAGPTLAGTSYQIGANGNLQNHHPISFNYGAVALVDDEIAPVTTALTNGSGMLISDLLWGGNLECVSCHDVHNSRNTGTKFTWVQDTQSALCFTCHIK